MKKTMTLAALAATALSASAATTFLNDEATTNGGNYAGQTYSLNDAGFDVSGDAFGATVDLTSITYFNRAGSGDTAGNIFLNVYDGSTFIGSSTNAIDWAALTNEGDAGVYNFANLTVSTSTVYTYRFSSTNADGDNDAAIRIQLVQPADLTSGTMLNSGGGAQDTAWDGKVTITAVPEPSSTALLGLGGLALIMRRRK